MENEYIFIQNLRLMITVLIYLVKPHIVMYQKQKFMAEMENKYSPKRVQYQ